MSVPQLECGRNFQTVVALSKGVDEAAAAAAAAPDWLMQRSSVHHSNFHPLHRKECACCCTCDSIGMPVARAAYAVGVGGTWRRIVCDTCAHNKSAMTHSVTRSLPGRLRANAIALNVHKNMVGRPWVVLSLSAINNFNS